MKKITFVSLATLFTFSFFATATSAQTVKEMGIKDFKYSHTLNGVTWEVSVDDKSKYSRSGIPEKRQGQVTIEKKQNKTSPFIKKITLVDFPNEDGVYMISMQSLSEPLFLVISRGGELSDEQRRVHLLAPSCPKPIAHFDAKMEEPSDLAIQASANDFRISFERIDNKKQDLTWSRPNNTQSLCSNGFR